MSLAAKRACKDLLYDGNPYKTDHNELLIVEAKVDDKTIGGVRFLVSLAVFHLVALTESFSHVHLAVLLLQTRNRGTVSNINGYAPTSAAPDQGREEFYQPLEETAQNERNCETYVVSDFNAVVGMNRNGLVNSGQVENKKELSKTSATPQLFERKLKIPTEKRLRQGGGNTISPKMFTAA
ncbi:hypothetical protein COOONC_10780 [Cooperia oncophora]